MTRAEPWQRECPGRSGQWQESPRGPEEAGGDGRRGWKQSRYFTLRAQGKAGNCLLVSGGGDSAHGGCPSWRLLPEGRYWAPALSRPQPCPPWPEPPPTFPYSTPREGQTQPHRSEQSPEMPSSALNTAQAPDPRDLCLRGSAEAPSYPHPHPWPVFAPELHSSVKWGLSHPQSQGRTGNCKAPCPVDCV